MAHRRGPWSPAEDAYLVQLVHTQGALNWVRIAQLIGSRSPKQCRERYHQNLKPSLNHEPISPEEGLLIERLVGEMGKRWAEIARRLNGRSDNAVKNWWNGSMNRRRRLILRRRTSSHGGNPFVERGQPQPLSRPSTTPSHALITSPNFHAMEEPLPSPASDISRAESVDRAPSLISDSGSNFSTSPRVAPSPTFELPPLHQISQPEARRPSLPSVHRSNSLYDSDHHAFAARFPSDGKLNTLSPITYGRPEYPHIPIPPSPREYRYDSRTQLPTAPPTPVQLPPLHISIALEQQSDRDVRMNLSSLLA
ncbi:Homeodomain-like protein [Xylogone sp. PMI_703]|nr:Homeodomain-like protein [Xylogone sp. PMI_703]